MREEEEESVLLLSRSTLFFLLHLLLLHPSDITAMHALQARQSLAAAARPSQRSSAAVFAAPARAAHQRSASVAVAAASYSPPSLRGATALDVVSAVSTVVPDTVLLGKTAASDAPTAATVSAAVLAGLAANPAAGVREFQVR